MSDTPTPIDDFYAAVEREFTAWRAQHDPDGEGDLLELIEQYYREHALTEEEMRQ